MTAFKTASVLLSFLSFSLASTLAHGATYDIPQVENNRIVISGLSAQVQLIAQPGATQLRISGIEGVADKMSSQPGHFIIVRKDNIIEIKMNDFDGKKEWKEALAKSISLQKKIEISGPSLPVEIQLRDGSVSLQKWSREARVSLVNGRINSQNGTAALQIHAQKADVVVGDHTGKVSVDLYSGNSTFKNIQGDIDLQQFSGGVSLDKTKGFVNYGTFSATAKMNSVSGSMQFENGKGVMSLSAFQGRLDGQSNEGAVSVAILADTDVNLKAKTARITVSTPPGSGAALNLMTVDGEIVVPKEVRVNRTGSEKNVRGRLRGDAQKGSIVVSSQEGSIIVK